jgi:hypothetical protein
MPLPGSSAAPTRAVPLSSSIVSGSARDHRGTQAGGARTRAGLDRHSERTLNAAEIDAVISQTLAREALAAERARRAVWRRTLETARNFAASLTN